MLDAGDVAGGDVDCVVAVVSWVQIAWRTIMQLCKVRRPTGQAEVGVLSEGEDSLSASRGPSGPTRSATFLHAEDPATLIAAHLDASSAWSPVDGVKLLPPLDAQEVWAAGVTYKRSREARERESAGAARFYDLVYSAERPELFFKATPRRVVGRATRCKFARTAAGACRSRSWPWSSRRR